MTVYATWVCEDIENCDSGVPSAVKHCKFIEARRPKEAATKAALLTQRHVHPWNVEVSVVRASSIGRFGAKIRKYCVTFNRTIRSIKEAK